MNKNNWQVAEYQMNKNNWQVETYYLFSLERPEVSTEISSEHHASV
jgi:hypothetical protein